MKSLKHWQDVTNAILGAWLFVSPWAMGYADATMAMLNALIVGTALLAVALGAIFVPEAWEEWTEGGLALWLVASPWVLGFAGVAMAMITAVLTGGVIAALALWVLMTDRDYNGWMHHSPEH